MPAELRFDGLVAVVTGGGSGMGRGYSKFLASRGAKVVVNDFHPSGRGAEEQTVAEILAEGGDAIGVNGSVLEMGAVESVIDRAVGEYGRLDILINNAGTSELTLSAVAGPDDRFLRQMDIHAMAPMRMVAAGWKHLCASGHGRVVNVASSSAYGGCVEGVWEAAYGPAKAAVITLSRQMAGAGQEYGVKVNALVPWAYTPMVERNVGGTDFGNWMKANMPIERVVAVVGYLVHPDCAVTGQTFTAAGGRVTRVFYGSSRGYFKRDLTAEDVMRNIDVVLGQDDGAGYQSDIFDLKDIETEFAEHDRILRSTV